MDNEKRINMRIKAISFHELIKGFITEPMDNSMKTCIKFADYILEDTQDVAEEAFQRMLNGIYG